MRRAAGDKNLSIFAEALSTEDGQFEVEFGLFQVEFGLFFKK